MNKERIVLLSAGLGIGIALALLFRAESPVADINVKPEEIKKKVLADEQNYDHIIDSFKQGAQGISQKLNDTKKELARAQKKNTSLQSQVNDLVYKTASALMRDTLAMLTDCDSLKSKVVLLMENDNVKDNLYAGIDSSYQSQLALKDSVIQTQRDKYISLKQAFNQSAEQLQSASLQLHALKKQVKRQNPGSRLRAAGALIIGGLVTGIILSH